MSGANPWPADRLVMALGKWVHCSAALESALQRDDLAVDSWQNTDALASMNHAEGKLLVEQFRLMEPTGKTANDSARNPGPDRFKANRLAELNHRF